MWSCQENDELQRYERRNNTVKTYLMSAIFTDTKPLTQHTVDMVVDDFKKSMQTNISRDVINRFDYNHQLPSTSLSARNRPHPFTIIILKPCQHTYSLWRAIVVETKKKKEMSSKQAVCHKKTNPKDADNSTYNVTANTQTLQQENMLDHFKKTAQSTHPSIHAQQLPQVAAPPQQNQFGNCSFFPCLFHNFQIFIIHSFFSFFSFSSLPQLHNTTCNVMKT